MSGLKKTTERIGNGKRDCWHVKGFEDGKINRRQLIQSLALVAVAVHGETVVGQTGVGFKTLGLDHISYTIEDWVTDRVRAELERRGFNPRLDAGGSSPNYVSYHVPDPDGFDLQISGTARPGDSRYSKP